MCFSPEQMYEASRHTVPVPNADAAIQAHLAQGRFVIVHRWIVTCPRTDAMLGSASQIHSVYDSDQAARLAMRDLGLWDLSEEDCAYTVMGPDMAHEAPDDAEFPF